MLLFLPLCGLPYAAAFAAWVSINLVLLGWVVWFGRRHLLPVLCPGRRWPRLAVTAAALAYFPALITLSLGQVSILLLSLFALALWWYQRGHDGRAGLVLAAGLFKFHLLLPLLLCLAAARRWRLLGGFLLGAAGVGLLSFAVAGPRWPAEYAGLIWDLSGTGPADERLIKVAIMPNLRALVMAAAAGRLSPSGAQALTLGLSALLLVPVVWLWRRYPAPAGRRSNRHWALAVSVALWVAYHSYVYDYMLLLIPLALAADYALPGPDRAGARWALGLLTLFFLTPIPYYLFLTGAWRGPMFAGQVALMAALWFESYSEFSQPRT